MVSSTLPYRVGAAVQDITPWPQSFGKYTGKGNPIVLQAQNTYITGGGQPNAANGVETVLSVRATAITDSSGNSVIIAILDTHSFNFDFGDAVRAAISQQTSLPIESILVGAVHIHSGPTLHTWCPGSRCECSGQSCDERCPEFVSMSGYENEPDSQYVSAVQTRTIQAAVSAWNSRVPATLSFGTSTIQLGWYRRVDLPDYFAQFTPYPQRVDVLEANDANGNPIVILFCTACHPTEMMQPPPSPPPIDISSDYPGVARAQLETLNPGLTAIFMQGMTGDIDPNTPTASIIGNKNANGAALAAVVTAVRSAGTMTSLSGSITTSCQRHTLALRDITSAYPGSACPVSEDSPMFMRSDFVTLQIGSGASGWTLATLSHEMLAEYEMPLRAMFPIPNQTTVAGYMNAVEGYIPTEWVQNQDHLALGVGYEGFCSFAIYWKQRREGLWSNADVLLNEVGISGGPGSLSLTGGVWVDVNAPAGSSLDLTGVVTAEAWIQLNNAPDTNMQPVLERYSSSGGGFALRVEGNGNAAFYTITNSQTFTSAVGSTVLQEGTWYHLAGVFNGTQLQIYVNGVLDGSGKGNTPVSGTTPLRIGAQGDDASATFQGLITEARVTAAVVYSANFTPQNHLPSISQTRGLWKFGGGTLLQGVQLFDATAYGNNGTSNGAVAFSAMTPPAISGAASTLSLTGGTSFVDVANVPAFNLTPPFTVEAWINPGTPASAPPAITFLTFPSDGTNAQGLVERFKALDGDVDTAGTELNDGGFALRLVPASSPASGFLLYFAVVINAVQPGPVSSEFLQSLTSANPLGNGWQHVAAVTGASSDDSYPVVLYVNGKQVGSDTFTILPAPGTCSLKIGARADGWDTFWGEMHDVRISAAAVYPTTPGSSFTPQNPLPLIANTVGLWHLADSTANDAASDNNGLLYGGAVFT